MRKSPTLLRRMAMVVALSAVLGGLAACAPVPPSVPTPDALAQVRTHVAKTLAELKAISDKTSHASNDRVITLIGAMGLLLENEQDWLDAHAPEPLDASVQVYEQRIAAARDALGPALLNPTNETITKAGEAVLAVRAAGSLIAE